VPGVIAKAALREAIEKDSILPEEIRHLTHRPPVIEGGQNILDVWWHALTITFGSLELAYRRGYQAGCEDTETKNKKK
jgi:hypothetical protein